MVAAKPTTDISGTTTEAQIIERFVPLAAFPNFGARNRQKNSRKQFFRVTIKTGKVPSFSNVGARHLPPLPSTVLGLWRWAGADV
jgi:hypothetical protein